MACAQSLSLGSATRGPAPPSACHGIRFETHKMPRAARPSRMPSSGRCLQQWRHTTILTCSERACRRSMMYSAAAASHHIAVRVSSGVGTRCLMCYRWSGIHKRAPAANDGYTRKANVTILHELCKSSTFERGAPTHMWPAPRWGGIYVPEVSIVRSGCGQSYRHALTKNPSWFCIHSNPSGPWTPA